MLQTIENVLSSKNKQPTDILASITTVIARNEASKRIVADEVTKLLKIPVVGSKASNNQTILRHGGSAVYLTHGEVIEQRKRQKELKEQKAVEKEKEMERKRNERTEIKRQMEDDKNKKEEIRQQRKKYKEKKAQQAKKIRIENAIKKKKQHELLERKKKNCF